MVDIGKTFLEIYAVAYGPDWNQTKLNYISKKEKKQP